MALDYNRLTTITRDKVFPKIVDQIGKESPTLGKFLDKATQGSGKTVQQPVKYRHNSQGGYYSGLETLDSAQENTRTRATWNWKQFHHPIVMSNIEKAKNMGKEGIISLISEEMADAKSATKDQLSTALFSDGTGNDGKEMDGLLAAVDDGTNVATYGSIDRSTYTWWQANYTAVGGALTLAVMATMYDSCENGHKRPTVIVTTKDIWTDYEALLQDQIRFVNSNGEDNKLHGGAMSLMFRSTPIIKDQYCPSGKMFFLNMDSFKFLYLKHPNHPTDKRGFSLRPMSEPDNQDGEVGYIFNYHQLVCVEPRANGQLDTIA